MTIIIGAISTLVLPESISKAKFLTEEERAFASRFLNCISSMGCLITLVVRRFNADGRTGPAVAVDRSRLSNSVSAEKAEDEFVERRSINDNPREQTELEIERFEWREVRRAVFDVQTWLTALSYLAVLTSLYSYSLFL